MLATDGAGCTGATRDRTAAIPLADGKRPICLMHQEHMQPDATGAWYCPGYAVFVGAGFDMDFMAGSQLRPTLPYRRATLVRTADKTPDKPKAAGTIGCARPGRRRLQSRQDLGRLFRGDAAAWRALSMTAAVAFK